MGDHIFSTCTPPYIHACLRPGIGTADLGIALWWPGPRAPRQPAQIYRLSVDQSCRPQTAANGGARGGAGPVGVAGGAELRPARLPSASVGASLRASSRGATCWLAVAVETCQISSHQHPSLLIGADWRPTRPRDRACVGQQPRGVSPGSSRALSWSACRRGTHSGRPWARADAHQRRHADGCGATGCSGFCGACCASAATAEVQSGRLRPRRALGGGVVLIFGG